MWILTAINIEPKPETSILFAINELGTTLLPFMWFIFIAFLIYTAVKLLNYIKDRQKVEQQIVELLKEISNKSNG
jgi:large-conductance mechanosensitive channel